jgi:hypothetical protein
LRKNFHNSFTTKLAKVGPKPALSDMNKIIEDLLSLQTLQLDSPKNNGPKVLALRELIPSAVLNQFDRHMGRGKKAVALVQNGVCRGCQIQVPVGVVNVLMLGVGTPVCGNCGRYLCLLEADAASFLDRNKVAPAVTISPKALPARRKAIRLIKSRTKV